MKLYSIILSLSAFFLFCFQAKIEAALGPDSKQEKSPKKVKLYGYEDQYGFEEMIADLKNAQPNDIIFINQFILSNTDYLKALEQAVLNGATVQAIINSTTQSIELGRDLQKKGIQVFVLNPKLGQSLHTKSTGSVGKFLYDGSANATHQAYSGNKETVMRIISQEIIESAFNSHKALIKKSIPLEKFDQAVLSPTKLPRSPIKPPLVETPKKPTRITSLDTNIRRTLKRRIENTQDEDLWINLYGIDQKDMEAVIEQKHQNIKVLCVNFHNLANPETKKFLIKLRRNDVPVYIYNVDGKEKFANKYPLINHQKIIIRGNLVMTGSENPTEKNSRDINQFTFFPDAELAKELRNQIEAIAAESTAIEDIKTLEAEFRDWYIKKSLDRFEHRTNFDNISPKYEYLHYKVLNTIAQNIEALGSNHPAYEYLKARIATLKQKIKDAALKSAQPDFQDPFPTLPS
ncbi:MAG TPA: phospholipase D-like domain-containing protein [Candidatus Babeliales bacterium]|nr:phospholipase D-like domain-containing protein [Candidatus Babeliales bacterium]